MDFTFYLGFYERIREWGIEKTLEYAKEHGFTSTEILCGMDDTENELIADPVFARRLRRALDEYQMPIACYSVGADIWAGEPAIQKLKKHAEIARNLGSRYLHHTLLPWMDIPEGLPAMKELLHTCADAAEQVANYAKELGIVCIYEEQGRCVNGIERFGIFYEEMKKRCENIGVCGDTGNILFVNEKPEDFFEVYKKEIRHVHVKDYIHKADSKSPGLYWRKTDGFGWIRHTMVGNGVVNIEACMNILKSVNYEGRFALELMHPEPFEDGVRQAMEYVSRFGWD